MENNENGNALNRKIPGETIMTRQEIEEAKQRVLASANTQGPKNLKAFEIENHNKKMASLYLESSKHRGIYNENYFADLNIFVSTVDDYVMFALENNIYPSLSGLALYCNVSVSTLKAWEKVEPTRRGEIVRRFEGYCSEYFNQAGLAASTNPMFSIYYGKSVMKQRENDPSTAIQVNVNTGPVYKDPEKVYDLVKNIPDI